MEEERHEHQYEVISHPAITPEGADLGIRAAEVRQCTRCGKIMTFVMLKDEWIPLFKDEEAGGRDILLA
jgi:hypothetical protein